MGDKSEETQGSRASCKNKIEGMIIKLTLHASTVLYMESLDPW